MKIIFFTFLFITAIFATGLPSHCSNTEQIIFNCRIKNSNKILSLCASKNFSKTSGYLQYRFGGLDKIELEFPKERKQSQKEFLYRHYFRSQVDRTEISFENHKHTYTIYSYYEGDTPGETKIEDGISVDGADFQCGEPINASFAPLEDAILHDKEW